jgi:hypothetical protein
VAQERIVVGVVAEHRQERLDGVLRPELAERHRREEADPRLGVLQQRHQRAGRTEETGLATHLRRLGADLRVRVGQ